MNRSRPVVVVLTADDVPAPADLGRIEELAQVRLATADTLADHLPGADVLLVWDIFSSALAAAWHTADTLRWMHVAAAGLDAIMFDDLRASDVLVTNARGVFDEPMAEYVLACVLAHDKQLHQTEEFRRRGEWVHRETLRVKGRRVLVVGTGGIGRAIARILTAVGLEVRGAGRTVRDDDPDFGAVVSSTELAEHLADVDHLVMVAPLTDATRGMLGARELAALPDDAHVINVGRGPLIDQAALTAEIATGRLSAHLDVLIDEPLPADDPLWTLPGAHISPHMSGDVIGWRDTLSAQFLEKLTGYISGREPGPAVDKKRGYVPTTGR
ncbi:D-2-hydroxyacid dehydrogenase [Gordonia sp. (in: high G+C Gram-positive bacteria)]|uniref:D-2-hydroxyacid dehydrogenase n=1 Tax=Gordonia sp. (in: high G+C Gram-positive bacteria) TaxID=84139 RepID=UPI0016B6021C|nr:D-2-hydroxyacid dehydrogenase [Gordonia sp. (in: high G+C Gram-positive bacteria)]NLG46278.1 D-2-hydroxyacid dehydrogenase [Gordonia sp. (in: high G+C Gram-positive bacteria)]